MHKMSSYAVISRIKDRVKIIPSDSRNSQLKVTKPLLWTTKTLQSALWTTNRCINNDCVLALYTNMHIQHHPVKTVMSNNFKQIDTKKSTNI
jgi:hypothetical protein